MSVHKDWSWKGPDVRAEQTASRWRTSELLRLSRPALRRWSTAVVAAGALVVSVVSVVSVSASASPGDTPAAPPPASKIAPEVQATLGADDVADIWVRLSTQVSTSGARTVKDRTVRGQRVVDALRVSARISQAPVRRLLDAEGIKYETFWVSNAILVKNAPRALAEQLATLDGVAEIRARQKYELAEPVAQKPASVTPNAIEWGLANINADDVWAQGDRGTGIVVASIDTGVQYDHPALVNSYRGNKGDGTFDHNYNWFDAQGTCPDAPCDNHGHGTHTMGIMAGDDGAGNQIGVAPGVTWIAANGCCPSDEALLRSSEWMLAPTDLSGQNPDVSKRPHIVNNSWGSEVPTNDPFLEDIQQAWADSGIFGVWSNGNLGPSCRTSGTPGSRTLNYSTGAYDVNNEIADFSSRGSGQDGQIKPDIAAPGVDVRSSVPGNGYSLMSGTSMAAPHLSGAIALLWAAHPNLARDIQTTRDLLDLTAVNKLDTQCGGDEEDNNVYGEGRLDALALVNAGAVGIGTISGRVTDAETGDPVTEATMHAAGPVDRTIHIGSDGTYTSPLVPGEYQVSVTGAFGYEDTTATVQVGQGGTLTHDVALPRSGRVAVSGAVTDGSGHGWPLYAKVTIADQAGHAFSTFSDPTTGKYRLPVVPDHSYTLRVTAAVSGYTELTRNIDVNAGDSTEDAALTVTTACTAPGYRPTRTGTVQTFDGTKAPRGWTVTNLDRRYPGYRADKGWAFNDPGRRTNTTGGSGNMAIVDSDLYGQFYVQDTVLTGPVVDLSAARTPAVEFATALQPAVNATATVEVTTDAGKTWTTVWRNKGKPGIKGPDTQVVELTQAAGAKAAQIRFHYTGQWSGWWQVDDVFVGDRVCIAVPGALVTGQVTDADTGAGLTGATVASVTNSGEHTTTVSTPDDPATGDGLYWLFTTSTGSQEFTATAPDHTPTTSGATVTTGQSTTLDFTLTRTTT